MRNFNDRAISPQLNEEQKILLGLTVMLLLTINFALNYLTYTYFEDNLLDIDNNGIWLYLINSLGIAGIVFLVKWVFNWSWQDLGLGRPTSWYKPILVAAGTFVVVVLFAQFIVPVLEEFSGPINISHLQNLKNNFVKFVTAVVLSWLTVAFIQELVFRAFLINSLDSLMGNNKWSAWVAVVISSVVFGLGHAYQGFTGILVTTCIGLIFGTAFILNSRRIWPLILVHGLVDSIFLFNIYNA